MNPIAALNEGGRQVLRLRRLVLLFYLVNLVAAVVVIAPAVLLIGRRLAHSLESERLYSHFDPAWLIETLTQFQWWPLSGVGITFAVIAALYFVLSMFLAGGAIAVFARDQAPFFSSCARYFPRLLRLMLLSIVFYGIILSFNSGITGTLNRARESSMESHIWIIAHWIQLLIAFFLLCTVNMIFDYGKTICVLEDRGAIRATIGAFHFVLTHLGRTMAVYWTTAAIGFLFLAAYHGITEGTGQDSQITVLLVLVLRQLYTLVRIWLRLWTWSSELHAYTFNSAIVAPEPPSLAVAG